MVRVGAGGVGRVSGFNSQNNRPILIMISRYVSELVYIHTKLMIVDDRKVIVSSFAFSSPGRPQLTFCLQMGSANLNDRSQKVCTLHSFYHSVF